MWRTDTFRRNLTIARYLCRLRAIDYRFKTTVLSALRSKLSHTHTQTHPHRMRIVDGSHTHTCDKMHVGHNVRSPHIKYGSQIYVRYDEPTANVRPLPICGFNKNVICEVNDRKCSRMRPKWCTPNQLRSKICTPKRKKGRLLIELFRVDGTVKKTTRNVADGDGSGRSATDDDGRNGPHSIAR